MPVSLPFDDTGLSPGNLVENEIHVLTQVNSETYFTIIPIHPPFYLNNLSLTYEDTLGVIRPLVFGVDYDAIYRYKAASISLTNEVFGGISLHPQNISGVVKMTYQGLGGDFEADRNIVLQNIIDIAFNSRTVPWDIITDKQILFPPINHDISLDYVYGHQDLIDCINGVANAIAVRNNTLNINYSNATKASLGLDQVPNIPLATDTEVQEQQILNKLVTLRQIVSFLNLTNGGSFTSANISDFNIAVNNLINTAINSMSGNQSSSLMVFLQNNLKTINGVSIVGAGSMTVAGNYFEQQYFGNL